MTRSSALIGLVGASVATSLALAGPAAAEPAEGWPVAPAVDPLHVVLVLVGIPLGLALVIAVAVYVPAMIRGERLAPGAPSLEDQWLGGPRRAHGELAAPDDETSKAGGASARW